MAHSCRPKSECQDHWNKVDLMIINFFAELTLSLGHSPAEDQVIASFQFPIIDHCTLRNSWWSELHGVGHSQEDSEVKDISLIFVTLLQAHDIHCGSYFSQWITLQMRFDCITQLVAEEQSTELQPSQYHKLQSFNLMLIFWDYFFF